MRWVCWMVFDILCHISFSFLSSSFSFFSFVPVTAYQKRNNSVYFQTRMYTDVALFFFLFFSKTFASARERNIFSFSPTTTPLALAVNKSPAVFTFYHGSLYGSLRTADAFPVRERSDDRKCVCCSQASSKDFEEKKEGLWTGYFQTGTLQRMLSTNLYKHVQKAIMKRSALIPFHFILLLCLI